MGFSSPSLPLDTYSLVAYIDSQKEHRMSNLSATLDAIALLEQRYNAMIDDRTPPVIRRVLHRAIIRLESDARRMLTGE